MARLGLLRGLILGSLVLLLLFLCYWLNTRYDSEREVLQKDLTVKLESTEQELSDTMVMKRFFAIHPSDAAVLKHTALVPGEHMSFKINLKPGQHMPLPKGTGEHIRVVGVENEVNFVGSSDTPDKM